MATVTLILGKSGSGKSASLRNLNPETCGLIQVIGKRLPFKGAKAWEGRTIVTDDYRRIIASAQKMATKVPVIIIDDFQYLLANEFMRRSDETGFGKFTEIGRHTWDVFDALLKLPEDVRVYILSHTEETEAGQTKMKTIGRLLDEKITLEGLVTIVLRAVIQDSEHYFSTRNNGSDTTKAPMGMFEEDLIDNDLAVTDAVICDYYGIAPQAAAA